MDLQRMQSELGSCLHEAGASLVGFAELSPLPEQATGGLRFGISVGIALKPGIVAALGAGPTPEYHAEYNRVNSTLGRATGMATDFLRARGFVAASGPATVRTVEAGRDTTPLPHKTVATRAGLGWIGPCALLVTPAFGSAIRLGSVLTNAPLTCARPIEKSHCGRCRRCVEACPARAVVGRSWFAGLAREQMLDAAACREKASALASAQGIDVTICGICIHVCPWTQRYLRRSTVAAPSVALERAP